MHPTMRPKVTADTFFLPDPQGFVFFRNNRGSFRMEGPMIDKWIEKLMPAFNGDHTLEELTSKLPEAHRSRVFEIAEGLSRHGFVRDVSQDLPHSLPEGARAKFAAQIDFLDALGGSGAFRFQKYRQSRVLAAGSGAMLTSLVSALLESGLPQFQVLVTEGMPTDRKRLTDLAAYARLADPEVHVEEIGPEWRSADPWREIVGPYDWILFAACENEIGTLRALEEACREKRKNLLPAVMLGQAGTAGPLVCPESEVGWESAWRRLHRSALTNDPETHAPSATAEALLTNLTAFELFKAATGAEAPVLRDQIYLLNLETLEGSRYSLLPYPKENRHNQPVRWTLVDGAAPDDRVSEEGGTDSLFAFFNRFTSPVTGIFHQWEEGDLRQLPLSVCRVQPVDLLTDGPAGLLPGILCGGFTHESARREAGLAGVEAYAARWFQPPESVGVGTGETKAEAVCRGLYRLLANRITPLEPNIQPQRVEVNMLLGIDPICDYYLRSLNTMDGPPKIALGEDGQGFPVAWVYSQGVWHRGVGFSREMAVRHALVPALITLQCGSSPSAGESIVPALEEREYGSLLESAIQMLNRRDTRVAVCELAAEPFLKERLAGVYGITLVRGVDVP